MIKGRNLTIKEKKAIDKLTKSAVNPEDYLVEKMTDVKGKKILLLRHKTTLMTYKVEIPI